MTNDVVAKGKRKRSWVALERVWSPKNHRRQVLITVRDPRDCSAEHYVVVSTAKAREIHKWLGEFLEGDW